MLVFDIESKGVDFKNPAWVFNDEPKKIHTICIECTVTGNTWRYRNNQVENSLEAGLKQLQQAESIGGHNIHGFDIPYIQILYPWFKPQGIVRDSKVESEMFYPAAILRSKDFGAEKKYGIWMDGKRQLYGRHSLEAWGARLKCPKDEYKKRCEEKGIDPWEAWNQDMEDYCAQDVTTNVALFRHLERKFDYEAAMEGVLMENKVAQILTKQTQHGVTFYRDKAIKLHAKLAQRQMEIGKQLAEIFPAFYMRDGKMEQPAKARRAFTVSDLGGITRKYKKEVQTGWWNHYEGAYIKAKLVEFNPASRKHIANRLMQVYGWKPTELTETGDPKVDEKVLEDLFYPPAKLLTEYLLLDKRLGQIAEGAQAWLKQDRNGVIHGKLNQNGTRTTRASHHSPNLGQVPKPAKPYGPECRACFGPRPGRKQVGVDLSGIELRGLGHYMARFDDGAYVDVVVNGDVHEMTRKVIRFNSRDNTKTAEYAYLYGAGDFKLGAIAVEDMTDEQREGFKANRQNVTKLGRAVRTRLVQGLNGMEPLIKACHRAAERRSMRALDGRTLLVPSKHSSLNTLLQHLGGILSKVWMVRVHTAMEDAGLIERDSWVSLPADQAVQMLYVHDELQFDCEPGVTKKVSTICIDEAVAAGKQLNLRVRTDAEAKTGDNWRECH